MIDMNEQKKEKECPYCMGILKYHQGDYMDYSHYYCEECGYRDNFFKDWEIKKAMARAIEILKKKILELKKSVKK